MFFYYFALELMMLYFRKRDTLCGIGIQNPYQNWNQKSNQEFRKGICKIQFHIDRTNDIVPLGEGEAVLEPVDDERGGAPRRPRRRAEQERIQQRVSGPQAGATALSDIIPLL